MKSVKANKAIETLIKKNEKEFDIEHITAEVKKLRVIALEEEDPLLVRVFRQIYEYLAENEAFDFTIEKDYTDNEETGEEDESPKEPGTDAENLNYLLALIMKSENKFNREEIKEMRTWLKENA